MLVRSVVVFWVLRVHGLVRKRVRLWVAVLGPAGLVVDSVAGALFGGLVGSVSGSIAGGKVGEQLDGSVLVRYRCLDCGAEFN